MTSFLPFTFSDDRSNIQPPFLTAPAPGKFTFLFQALRFYLLPRISQGSLYNEWLHERGCEAFPVCFSFRLFPHTSVFQFATYYSELWWIPFGLRKTQLCHIKMQTCKFYIFRNLLPTGKFPQITCFLNSELKLRYMTITYFNKHV